MSERPLFPDAPLMDAVRAIEASLRRVAIVVDQDNHLLGTLTDGDVRRHLLAGGTLEAKVSVAMNHEPLTAEVGSSEGYIKDLMRRGNVVAIPIVDQNGRYQQLVHLLDIESEDFLASTSLKFSFAVIMAGGEGTRLRPITEKIPKPMVEIGGIPLLERQILRLIRAGIGKVYISVNYLGHVIEDHFGDGSELGIEIRYLKEQEKLGTAGALTLLPERPEGPIIVMNGDILTTSDFDSFYNFHQTHNAVVTVAAIDHRVHIPYGVIRADGPFISKLVEKPSERFLCNAGIYAISPEMLDLLPAKNFSNMTDLVDTCLQRHLPVAVFPVHEYWNDIGTPDDLKKARDHFSKMETVHD